MRSLGFAPLPNGSRRGVRRVRQARLERRSSLPASAACVVANGVRETLGALLGMPVTLRLFEPVIPDPRAWKAIAHNATVYRVRGSVADAAIVLRRVDAATLAGAVFGEPATAGERALSPLECDVIDRTANAIAANLIAVCGAREAHPVERVAAIDGFITFFEMMIEKPMEARIGVALSRDPAPEPRGGLELVHLSDVAVATIGSIDLGSASAFDVVGLAVGAVVPIRSDDLRHCTLSAGGRRLARGACGVRGGRFAITIAGGSA